MQDAAQVADGVGYIPNTGDFAASLNRINFIVWDQDLYVVLVAEYQRFERGPQNRNLAKGELERLGLIAKMCCFYRNRCPQCPQLSLSIPERLTNYCI